MDFRSVLDARRTTFLPQATAAMAAAADSDALFKALANASVPTLGDWCAIDVPIGTPGRARRVATAHVDPALAELPLELQERYPADQNSPAGFPHVLRTGEVEYWPEVPESMLRAAAVDEEHLKIILRLGFASYICVPIVEGGRVLAAMTFVSTRPERHFGPADLSTAEELARRAAVALEALTNAAGNGKPPPRATQTS